MAPAGALAQGFAIQPMRVEATPQAGRTIELPIRVTNTSVEGVQTIQLRLVELSQAPEGSWQAIEADGAATVPVASAVSWITLSTSSISVDAANEASVNLSIDVPANARGAYFAALLAETPIPEGVSGFLVRVRFLIPIIIQIQGRPVRQEVNLSDLTMAYVDKPEQGQPETTIATLHVANEGRTYSRIRGKLVIERQQDARWLTVGRVDLAERGIIPGAILDLGENLMRRLPSGKYRLGAQLWVDGRRVAPLDKELDFIGDPLADLAYDAAFSLDPPLVQMEVVEGATRTATIAIENLGSDTVNVVLAATTPAELQGVATDTIRGEMFSAEGWTKIVPARVELRPHAVRRIRVISSIPKGGADQPNYYASLSLSATYEDGQNAGEAVSLIHLENRDAESAPRATVPRLFLAEGERNNEYVVQTQLANIGNVHLMPSFDLQVIGYEGQVLRSHIVDDFGPLLPLGRRSVSGVLDFSPIAPGYYVIRSTVGFGAGLAETRQLLIEVTADAADASVRRVTVVDEGAAVALPEVASSVTTVGE